jgi:hypothetical protein
MVKAEFTVKSDVWSWAILAIEIYTDGAKPFPTVTNADLPMQIMAGLRPAQPTRTCPDDVYELIETCWKLQATDRPDFDTLHGKLRNMKQLSIVPPDVLKGAHSGTSPAFNNDYTDFETGSVLAHANAPATNETDQQERVAGSDNTNSCSNADQTLASGALSDDYEMPTRDAAAAPIEAPVNAVSHAAFKHSDQGRSRYVSTGFVRAEVAAPGVLAWDGAAGLPPPPPSDEPAATIVTSGGDDAKFAIPCKYGCGHMCDAKDQCQLQEHEASCTSFYTAVDSFRASAGNMDSATPPFPGRRLSGPLRSSTNSHTSL